MMVETPSGEEYQERSREHLRIEVELATEEGMTSLLEDHLKLIKGALYQGYSAIIRSSKLLNISTR